MLSDFNWLDLLDIACVSVLIYRGLLLVRGTRAAPMLAGLTIVVLAFLFARVAGLVTLHWILGNFLGSIILVVVVLFQEEIRRGLTKVGLSPFFSKSASSSSNTLVNDIAVVVERLANERLGALIVIQRDVGLDNLIEDAVEIDSLINRKLLFSIFIKQSPLHDGAVIIANGRIKAASCVLPLSYNPDINPNLGTRHRAAFGISERSDAVVVVVSEETSSISIVSEGKVQRAKDLSAFKAILEEMLKYENYKK